MEGAVVVEVVEKDVEVQVTEVVLNLKAVLWEVLPCLSFALCNARAHTLAHTRIRTHACTHARMHARMHARLEVLIRHWDDIGATRGMLTSRRARRTRTHAYTQKITQL